ncbi:MAG: lysophospholipid acyltransferase family protein [Bacteroidota bacterium]
MHFTRLMKSDFSAFNFTIFAETISCMNALIFYIAIPFIWLFTALPFFILFRISDFFYLLTRLVGYRSKIIDKNLRNSFPGKEKKEIRRIKRKYYRHFADIFFETFKGLFLNSNQIKKRYKFRNLEILEDLYKNNRSVMLVTGHYGNWEWMISLPLHNNQFDTLIAYRPLHNPFFDKFIYKVRIKFGAKLISMQQTPKTILEYSRQNKRIISYLLVDQAPRKENPFWITFLNQPTQFFQGAERISMKTKQAVVYADIQKKKRGYYEIYFDLLFEKPEETKPGEITTRIVRRLEQEIITRPEFWLWSHNRWKRSYLFNEQDEQLANNSNA